MAIALADNIRVGAQKPIDDKYYNGLSPYISIAQANSLIASTVRFQGLTVNIAGDEYWYKNGILNTDLILKGSSTGGAYVPYTGATQDVNLGVYGLFTPLVSGSTLASGNLTLQSTSNASKGFIYLGANSAYQESLGLLGINNPTPTAYLDLPVGTTQHAPLRLSPSTGASFPALLNTLQEGAVEYDLNKLYFTLVDPTSAVLGRRTVILDKNLDGVNIGFGTAVGTQLGTNIGEKLAFWGTTPIAQPINTTPVDTLLVNTGLIASGATSYSFTTDLEANALIKTGGLSTEYLMADGSVTTGVSGGLYGGPSPSTVPVQNIPAGTNISTYTYDQLLGNIYAPYNAPSISVAFVTPTLNYNATQGTTPASTVSVSFTWTKAAGTPDLTSAVIEYQRPGSSPSTWTIVSSTTIPPLPSSASSITISSSSILLNPTTPDNATVFFRVTCIDGGGTNIGTAQTAFLSYQLPTANLTLATTPSLQNNKYIRPLSYLLPSYQVAINGTITQNSVNVPISTYSLERAYSNGGPWTNIVSGGFSPTIPTTIDTTQPVNANNVYIRATIADTQNPGGIDINNVSSFGIYRPIFFGGVDPIYTISGPLNPFNSAALITSVNNGDLVPIPDGVGGGFCNYSNTSLDRFINNILLTIAPGSPKKFCFAYPAIYGALSGPYVIKNNATNSYIQGNFVNNTGGAPMNVVFPDGSTIQYFVYLYINAVTGAPTTYDLNICPNPC
jgi:hypothetical protein